MIVIKKSTPFLYFASISFVMGSSAYLKSISQVGLIMDVMQLFVLGYCLFYLVKDKQRMLYPYMVILFYVVLGISTYLGSREYNSYIVYAIQGIGATLFVCYGAERCPKEMVRSLRNTVGFFVLLNLLLMLFMPNGFSGIGSTTYYLLGYRIAFTPFICAMVFFALLDDCLAEKRISVTTIFMIGIAYVTVFLENVATGIVTLTAAIAIMLFCMYRRKMFSLYKFYIFYTIIFISIVVFNIQYHIPFFSYFITDVLGKDLSFDNRTTIWMYTLAEIIRRPILGYGVTGGGGVLVEFEYRKAMLSAHNQILNTLWEGGIAALLAFGGMCIRVAYCIKRLETEKTAIITGCFIVGLFVMMFTEVQMTKAFIFLIFAMAACLPDIEERY